MEVIVDLFNQHGGDLVRLNRMIAVSYLSGANVAKIQILNSKRIWGDDSRKYLELSFDQVKAIKMQCDLFGMEFMATAFDEEGLEWINELGVRRYKIASVTSKKEKAFCDKILSYNKPTIISTGMHEAGEFPFGFDSNISYLFCVSEYPTRLDNPKLKEMPKVFGRNGYSGYSDHTLGEAAALMAFHRGAVILEKHFTFSPYLQKDTQLAHLCSFTPESLTQFRNIIDESLIILGQ